jgi:hypothetical protein
MAIDPLQQIAEARAIMLMRGYSPLRLVVGIGFWRELCRADPALSRFSTIPGTVGAEVLDMPCMVRADMEGFVVEECQIR